MDIEELTKVILKEIQVFEAGYQVTDPHRASRSTASFYIGLKNSLNTQAAKRSPVCALCKDPHLSYSCTTVTENSARIDLVKKESLYFNCLGHHKMSQCSSKFRCKRKQVTQLQRLAFWDFNGIQLLVCCL